MKPVSHIINDFIEPNKRQYVIPVYQRNYEWTAEQCNKLFEDIISAHVHDKSHFCGAIIYASLNTENKIEYFVIIDGQQRLTTIYILIKALFDSADIEADKDRLKKSLFNVDKYSEYGIDEASKLKLKPIKSDDKQLKLLMADKIKEMDPNSGIYRNYFHFKELIENFLEENTNMDISKIYDGLERLTCAEIRLEDDDDNAQEIFERINSTGIPLSLSDKIRNFVLMGDKNQERLYEEYWLQIEHLLTKKELLDFFLDYLNFKKDGFTKEISAYEDFKSIYKNGNFTNEDILKEIYKYAKHYHVFKYGSNDICKSQDMCKEINGALQGLSKLKQTTVFLFLFKVFDDFQNEIIDEKTLAKVLKFLLSYSIRRLVCEVGSNSLRGLYKTLYTRVFNCPENKQNYYDAIVSFFQQLVTKDGIPSEEDFLLALKERNLYSKNALCRYLLESIENQGKENLEIKTNEITIEHIMPQNKNISTAWQKMLGSDWMIVKDRYLHTLGNLTLTAYNRELGDLPFAEKLEKLSDLVTHVTVLYSDVKDKKVWNAQTIEARAERLAKIICNLFPIEKAQEKVVFIDPRYKEYTVADPDDATFKYVHYYTLLGERVIVGNFAEMVRSVAFKLYSYESQPIELMASSNETFKFWKWPIFSYDKNKLRRPKKLFKDSDIYIGGNYSAHDCVCIIKHLLNKYELNPEEDFTYNAR